MLANAEMLLRKILTRATFLSRNYTPNASTMARPSMIYRKTSCYQFRYGTANRREITFVKIGLSLCPGPVSAYEDTKKGNQDEGAQAGGHHQFVCTVG